MAPIRLLLQSSIPFTADDWHIGRFSLLAEELSHWAEVTARNRVPDKSGDDPLLMSLDRSQFDEVWLLGVDGGEGLTPAECEAVNRYHAEGGGLFTVRDHSDMGHWLRSIRDVGAAHFFHESWCWEPDASRHVADDPDNPSILWPNYHSGSNGDVEAIEVLEPVHPLMRSRTSSTGRIEYFPAHPHEGAVGAPSSVPRARVVARGHSQSTGRSFNLVVALERTANAPGRAVAESSFHHLADFNWDTSHGRPSFVSDRPSDRIHLHPELLEGVREYVRNCVYWLSP